MNKSLVIKGYWWLPATPENTVAGILTYTPNESITLELIGQLKPETSAIDEFMNWEEEGAILGYSSDAKEISLINCYPSGGNLNFSCRFPIQRYNCRHLIMGTHIISLDTPCFFKALINIPYLSLWATPNSIESKVSFEENQINKYCISFKAEENHIDAVEIGDYRLSIDGHANYRGEYFEPKIKQKTTVTLTNSSDYSLKDALKQIFLFEQFLSFAALKSLESSKIILYDKSKFQQLENGKKHFFSIEYICTYKKNNEFKQEQDLAERSKFLFTYETIKDEFRSIIKKWFQEQTDIAPIRHHLIECVRHKGTFSSMDFLVIIQAIEGFWWRFRDEDYRLKNRITGKTDTRLKTILNSLIDEFKGIITLELNKIEVNEVVDSRHYFSHFVPKAKKPFAKDGIELYHLTNQIRKLLICCVLNFIGFSNEQINKIVKKSDNKFLY